MNNKQNSNSLLHKILTKNLWRKLYTQTSEEGFTINDLIQPGLDLPNHFSGIVSHSKDCYFSFDELLIQAAQNFHKRNLYLTKYEKENFNVLLSLLNNMDNFLSKIIYEIKIETHRNFEGQLFSGKIKRNERREISDKVKNNLEKIEKEIYEEKEEKGFFYSFENNEKMLNDFLKEKNPFFSACGFYRDFPDGRVFYSNKNRTISINTNLEDHLKFILKAKENEEKNFELKNLQEYFEFINKLSDNLLFSFDSNLGYVNSLIENLGKICFKNSIKSFYSFNLFINIGSGCNYNLTVKIPLENKQKFLENIKATKEINVKELKSEDKFALVQLSNNSSFYNFTSFLLELINSRELFDSKDN